MYFLQQTYRMKTIKSFQDFNKHIIELQKPTNRRDHKNPSRENLNSLKEALSAVISDDKKETTAKKNDTGSIIKKEIPEDELKKVLGS